MMKIHNKCSDSQQFSDVLGMGSAFLCMLHCLAAPLLMGFGANHQQVESSFLLHEYWDIIFLSLGFIAVWYSSRHSQFLFIKVVLWLTYALLLVSMVLEHSSPLFEYAIYAASLAMIFAHSLNLSEGKYL